MECQQLRMHAWISPAWSKNAGQAWTDLDQSAASNCTGCTLRHIAAVTGCLHLNRSVPKGHQTGSQLGGIEASVRLYHLWYQPFQKYFWVSIITSVQAADTGLYTKLVTARAAALQYDTVVQNARKLGAALQQRALARTTERRAYTH